MGDDVDAYARILDLHLGRDGIAVDEALGNGKGADGAAGEADGDGLGVASGLRGDVGAGVVVVEGCLGVVVVQGDDGLSVLLVELDDRRSDLRTHVDELLGHFTHQVSVAAYDGLDGGLAGEVEGLGVACAVLRGCRSVDGVEDLCSRHSALDGDVGVHVLVLEREGGSGGLRHLDLGVGQHHYCIVDDAVAYGIEQQLLCVGDVDVAVVAHVVLVDGHCLGIAHSPGHDIVVGKASCERGAHECGAVGEGQHEGAFVVGILDELDVTIEGTVGIGHDGKLRACILDFAHSPGAVDVGIEVERGHEGRYGVERCEGLGIGDG